MSKKKFTPSLLTREYGFWTPKYLEIVSVLVTVKVSAKFLDALLPIKPPTVFVASNK